MPATYEPIATTTLGSAASSITFSSIPSTYTDLKVVLFIVGSSADNSDLGVRFNSDTTTKYSWTYFYGNGTSATTAKGSNDNYSWVVPIAFPNLTRNASLRSMATLDIFSYTGSTYKTVLGNGANDQNGAGFVSNGVGLWRSTSAITTIVLYPSSGNFASTTIATLYGIKAA